MTHAAQPNLFTRDDTFFGVCEGLGEDFGIHANWLRLAFAGAFFFAPALVTGVYVLLGVVVAVSRWMFPAPLSAEAEPVADQTATAATVAEPIAAGLFGAHYHEEAEAARPHNGEELPLAA